MIDLISGNQVLLKQRLDQLCDSLVEETLSLVKEILSFTQDDIDQSFSNINGQLKSLEKELILTKEDVGVIQTTEPT